MLISSVSDLKAGSQVESHAIILSILSLREADKLVHLLTPNYGVLAAVAFRAASSQKRFGAALEPLNHVRAQLRVPRDPHSTEAPLWHLNKVDLQDNFLHFRKNYNVLESGFFALRLVKDFVPESSSDLFVFKALGRFLRDSACENAERYPSWMRLSFWTWFAHHLGFGDLSKILFQNKDFFEGFEVEGTFSELWRRSLFTKEAHFGPLFGAFKSLGLPPILLEQEAKIYEYWLELSGIHWNYFEQWLNSKKYCT